MYIVPIQARRKLRFGESDQSCIIDWLLINKNEMSVAYCPIQHSLQTTVYCTSRNIGIQNIWRNSHFSLNNYIWRFLIWRIVHYQISEFLHGTFLCMSDFKAS